MNARLKADQTIAKATEMMQQERVSLLEALERLDGALEALGASPRQIRKTKTPKKPAAKKAPRKKPKWTPAARKAAAERAKKRWAAAKKKGQKTLTPPKKAPSKKKTTKRAR